MVQLCYFSSLREALGTGDGQVELPGEINDLAGLTSWRQSRNDTWRQALADTRLHVAINHQIVNTNVPVNNGDEITWFPPVTGG
ncbi:MAG: MoaD/ThiS family protein [Gammaproteobacteria bacterium]|nr:MoaD/ThiS family protein [Gammaproteobacteria bacterium]MDH3559955.1 MoaD/ThiS family protein [Gammaproteobacteria bacterium]